MAGEGDGGTVLVLGGELAPEGAAMLEAAGLPVASSPPGIGHGAIAALIDSHRPDAVVVRQITGRLDDALLAMAGRLRLIAKHGVGTNDIDLDAAARRGIPVAVTTGCNAHSVAEHALAMMLALAKDLLAQDAHVRAGGWERGRYRGRELRGQALGVVGFGAIGQALALMAAVMGMEVLAFDPALPDSAFPSRVARVGDLDRLLAEADIVSLHCPLTEATRGLIDARRLGLMKPGALLINTARGEVVDETALATALESGRLAGAGLDSFVAEPPAPDHPLLGLPNVLLSPHIAGVTADAMRAMSVRSAQSVLTVLSGGTLDPRFLAR